MSHLNRNIVQSNVLVKGSLDLLSRQIVMLTILLNLIFASLSIASVPDSNSINQNIKLVATLSDSAFKGQDSIIVENLENGNMKHIEFEKEFDLALPLDTIWGLCFTSKEIEKCYEVKYLGTDLVFKHNISGDSVQVKYVNTSKVVNPIEISADQDSIDQAKAEEQKLEALLNSSKSKTKLNKIVMQFRRRPKRELGKSIISTKQMKRLPTLAEADVIRSLQALPGVVASSDFSTKIYVRGGGSDQNLFLFDNAVVYSPVHFFGLFSTFLVEAIDDVSFYKGGFAPEYGNRLSSVVDIKSRDAAKFDPPSYADSIMRDSLKKVEEEQTTLENLFYKNSVKISTFAAQIHTEGKAGDLSWLLAGRTTYIKPVLEGLKKVKLTDFTLDYYFFDLQGNLRYDFSDSHGVRFSWYAGKDDLNFNPILVNWGNKAFPLNWWYRINNDWATRATFAYSYFNQDLGLSNILNMGNEMHSYNYKHNFEYSGIENHVIDFGVDLSKSKIDFSQEITGLSAGNSVDRQIFWLLSAYAQDKWRLNDLILTYGLRLNYQDLVDDYGIEPRASLTYEFSPTAKFDFHVGYYLQYINSIIMSDMESLNEFYYPATKTTNGKLPPSSSLLFSIGYSKDKLFGQYNITAEAYYKTINDMLILAQEEMQARYTNLNPFFYGDLSKNGEGYSFGYELSIRKDKGIINAGLNWSQGYSAFVEQWDTTAYNPSWHQAYALKGDIGVTVRGEKKDGAIFQHKKKGRYFRSSAQIKLASGMPFTEYYGYALSRNLDEDYSNAIALQGPRNGSTHPLYFRFDLKPLDVGKEGRWNFSWSILNVTDYSNIFALFYDTNSSPPGEIKVEQFPFFPILLNYELYF